MPVTMTKAAIKRVQVETRKEERAKAKHSLFMRRTLSIYNGQKKRMNEMGIAGPLPYTLEQFRDSAGFSVDIDGFCYYCRERLTVKSITADHKQSIANGGGWELENICFCCQPCNFQKGRLDGEEFRFLLGQLSFISPESATDIKRRLTIGGKWSPR